ncbi:hypothetical protein [Streptomyces sp. UNOB3_S3]|uniref:hypothetical protein n=1 Tax=Streptomyces sp. UNOB3_S3 TaxID=2871682 RepID=UPI001E48B817|nr:hypothetical protein [Streptomyces sp. UNOB3_S3]MCC3774427.1 hypothetical protein [Streptomyces sp. UNOB3_S3]
MPDTKLRKPQAPDRTNNLPHGGKRTDTCLRCKKPRSKGHGVPEVTESEELRRAIGLIQTTLRADTSERIRTGAFMIGVLQAEIRGRTYRLVASSGREANPWITADHLRSAGLKGWTIVNPTVPDGRENWKNLRGDRIDFPTSIKGVTSPCAAMKLLLGLADAIPSDPRRDGVGKVVVVEEYFKGKNYVPKDPKKESPQWRGEGEICSWTAHSCGPCEERIPYLICNAPANAIPD